MVRKVTSRKYEKEIRPRIKLYKFENLSEDVKEKLINEEMQLQSDILVDDLSQYGVDVISQYLVKNGIKLDSLPNITSWDLDSHSLEFKFDGKYKGYYIDYDGRYINSYTDAELADIPEKIYDKILDIVSHAKEEALKAMERSYMSSTDPKYIEESLIEHGDLYTANGELKEYG